MAPETRAMAGRKRGHAASPEPQHRSTSWGSYDAGAVTRQDDSQTNDLPQTPKPRQKRTRYSEPGPTTTGLTPAMGLAGLSGPSSRSVRRQSAPVFLSDTLMDPVIVRNEPINVQFSPLKQALDPRTRRRLVRSGLSEEMHRIEGEKKDLKKATAEIESLQKKLEVYESQQASGAHNNTNIDDNYETLPVGDFAMDGTMLMSDSPTFYRFHDARGFSSGNSMSPEDTSPITPHTGFTQQVSIVNDQSSKELRLMAEDLAAARKEKQDLFNEWRKLNADPAAEAEAEDTAPPADFMKQIVPQLECALAAAVNVSIILDTTKEEFDQLGFSGATLYDRLADMRESFKLAWKELERCPPKDGLPSQSNGKEILTALKEHLQQISISLMNEYQRFKDLSNRYKGMREEYYHISELLADEEDKVKKLEESRALDANDMIHVRSRLQALEEELEEKETAIARFSQNLNLVEEERDRYQNICGQVEEEHRTSEQRIAELNEAATKITNIADDRAKKLEEFKKLLVDKQEEVTNLSKKVDQLIQENSKLLDRYTKREQEIGRLNTLYAGVSTELQSTQADLQQTRLLNDMLETQNQSHINARNRIENFLNTAMTEVSKTFDVERERDRQNAVTKAILTGNGARHMQAEPEPSLPSNSPIKATLFGSNVRVGRGSDRSTLSSGLGLDSGIGGSETAQSQTVAPGSDAFLNAIDEEEDENIE